jgi:hypothetical protein
MKVQDLIEKLKEFPPDIPAVLLVHERGGLYVGRKITLKLVFDGEELEILGSSP